MTRIATLLAGLALSGTALAQDADLVDVAVAAGQFETLVAAVQAADLATTLKGDGPYTLFAPNDAAFAALADGVVETLLLPENKDQLVQLLTYHVVPGKVLAADVVTGEVKTVQGDTLEIKVGDAGVMVDGAKVLKTDVMARNGVIHILDAVVRPAPAKVAAPPPPPEPDPTTIVDIAAGHGSFGTLVEAVKAAGLADTLMGAGPYTVFAPTDDAFAKLAPGTLDTLLKPDNRDQLVELLTYHVVPGKIMASDIASGKVATVQGSELKIKAKNGAVKVDKAMVTTADVEASNGVIHVIDTVLRP